jgi:phytoene synthase
VSLEKSIFRNGSTTYYFSSWFFPKAIRQDVFKLYSFVRIADDYVDSIPQNKKEFNILRTLWQDAVDDKNFDSKPIEQDSVNERVVKNMIHLTNVYDFDTAWIESFLDSMQADVTKKRYASLDGSLWYVYGSAEVIGIMMAKIMNLPDKAIDHAIMQGRAMQWINFIRDIAEDNRLGRCYFPQEDLDKFKLSNLSFSTVSAKPEAFNNFINFQLDRYYKWQLEAEKGYKYIPKRLLKPLKTANDMYGWTAKEISADPLKIYQTKIKPNKLQVLSSGIKHVLTRSK